MFWDLVEDIRDGINRRFKARVKYELLFSKLYPGRWYLRSLFFTTGIATVVFTVVQIIGVLSLTESQATTLGGYIALWNIALLYIPFGRGPATALGVGSAQNGDRDYRRE